MRKLNYGMYLAFSALVYMLITDWGIEFNPLRWESYVSIIGYILVGLGIFSNPTDGKWFADKKDK